MAFTGLLKDHGIRISMDGNFVLGNERFKNETEQMLNSRVLPEKIGRLGKHNA
jgi:hypothetical protein